MITPSIILIIWGSLLILSSLFFLQYYELCLQCISILKKNKTRESIYMVAQTVGLFQIYMAFSMPDEYYSALLTTGLFFVFGGISIFAFFPLVTNHLNKIFSSNTGYFLLFGILFYGLYLLNLVLKIARI